MDYGVCWIVGDSEAEKAQAPAEGAAAEGADAAPAAAPAGPAGHGFSWLTSGTLCFVDSPIDLFVYGIMMGAYKNDGLLALLAS